MEDLSRDAELENYLDALNDFVKKPSKSIPSVLEQLIQRIARHGEPLFPWFKLKPLIVMKLENVIEEYIEYNPHEEVPILPNVENVRFDDMRERLLKALESFNSAPFTIQRLCELLTEPKRYYRRSDKFMRGIEKNVQVVSTITPSGKRITSLFDLQKSPPMMNGIVPDPEASPNSDNNGFIRPVPDAFTSSPSSSSSSSRVDAMNGVNRPYFNSDTMDAPLQFAYPLGQSMTSMPSSDSGVRTDLNRLNGTHSEPHEAEAKETSEAMPGVSQDSAESDSTRICEERTLGDDNIDNDTASVVSSSDAESFVGEGHKDEGDDEMEVDVASSGDAGCVRDGETEGVPTLQSEQGKDGNGDVSTSESRQASGELPKDVEEAGKADSSEGTSASTPMEYGEELSSNSEAASSENQSNQESEDRSDVRDTNTSLASPEQGQPEADIGAAGDAGPGDSLPGDAGPADSSNDAKSTPLETASENASGSSEADSKASSPETPASLETLPTSDPVEAVESSADAASLTPSNEPSTDDVTDSTPTDSTSSSDNQSRGSPVASGDGDAASSGDVANSEVCEEQPQSAESESTQS
ncbi:serine/threonine-protein phosphatase 4 regulatory subunit 2-A-like [Lytechinus variegatus]|uniref:serine/threonine-protein phosphatase 4 regulatory subunit 2-A-like n=1 Tax=Lytechinus variegatus TaxID=7654 RepID=UPI001BB0DC96|nr:serine/threonine-protein phosphatase 4 regulatory subunit 2-A-like [Lytechinus variegatus]